MCQFSFTVVLESSRSFLELAWEAAIWYDAPALMGRDGQWETLELHNSDDHPIVLSEGEQSRAYRYSFTNTIPAPFPDARATYKSRRVGFTVKYRTDSLSPWQWVKTQFGTKDGEIVFQPPVDPNFARTFPMTLEPNWNVTELASQAPDARLYLIKSTEDIPRTSNQEAKLETKRLERFTHSFHKFFALTRMWSPWLGPRHGEHSFTITEDAVLVSFLQTDGSHLVLLAVNGINDIYTAFRSDQVGRVVVAARNDGEKEGKYSILASTGWNFEVANSAVMYEARKIVRQSAMAQKLVDQILKQTKSPTSNLEAVPVSNTESSKVQPHPSPQWLQNWYDALGYCTWNSLGQNLTQEKIITGLNSLALNDIHVSTLIIDDGWQSLSGEEDASQFKRGMTKFEASPVCFPSGLRSGIETIRAKFPCLHDIAVWHALFGYWGGIAPNSPLSEKYKTVAVPLDDNSITSGTILAVDPSDIHAMFNDFYAFLLSCGITGVKTDFQSTLDLLSRTPDRRDFTYSYQSAWTEAHLNHFAGKAISCMSQIPQILFHSFLPTYTPRILLRNSDDFFPDIPASHPWHVFCNAHNSVLAQHLNALPDWDMFQTAHPYSGFHAASRCISGGPIYITDTPNEHDVKLIHEMSAQTVQGESVILRPSNVAKTINVYENYNENFLLKVGTYNGAAETGSGILGIFNIAEKETAAVWPVTQIPGIEIQETGAEQGRKKGWIIRSHVLGRITKPITPSLAYTPEMLISTTLSVRGYDILSAYPVHYFSLNDTALEVAVLGLLGKMTGACAIMSSNLHLTRNEGKKRLRVEISLKALGVLGIWGSDFTARDIDEAMMVLILGKPVPRDKVLLKAVGHDGSVHDESNEKRPGPGVLEIDIAAAWKDMGLKPGWSNEVHVEVFVG